MKLLSAIKYLMILFLSTAIGCEDIIENQTLIIGKESTYRIHQLYSTSDGQYSLQINEVSDSRCPQGVQCVWAGEVTLKGEWTDHQNKSAFELHSVVKNQEKQPDGFTIQIIDAKPYPLSGSNVKAEDIVVTLLINKSNPKLESISFPHSMKGWELYSWPNKSDWNYSILMGTNRLKTYEEVITNKVAVIGKDSLKMLLNKLPANEEILWIGKRTGTGWENLSFPDNNTVNEIKNYCTQMQLLLTLSTN